MRGERMGSAHTRKRDLEWQNQELPVVAGRNEGQKDCSKDRSVWREFWSVRGDVERCNKVLGVGRGSATAKGVI